MNFTIKDGNLNFAGVVANATARIECSDSTRYSLVNPVIEADGDTLYLSAGGDQHQPRLRWVIHQHGAGLILVLEVENTLPHSIAIERFDVLAVPAGYRSLALRQLQAARTGWQSWSPSAPMLPLPAALHNPAALKFLPLLPPTEAERLLFPQIALLGDGVGHTLLLGFTRADRQCGVIALAPSAEGHRICASSYAEGKPVRPGETLRSEPLLLLSDAPTPLETYADLLAAEMNALVPDQPPSGWCSWYYYFERATEADVLDNLHAISEQALPVQIVQVDDSFQRAIGDWLEIKETYPRGMKFLADQIRAKGYQPGIWIAPFLLSEASNTYQQHPDWVLRDASDLPLNAIDNWGTRNLVLDVTHPAAAAWLHGVIQTLVQDWGYTYLKLDFLYAGAARARRHDSSLTSIEAYRQGMQLIRDAAPDCVLLGCGAPFAPSVGLVHAMRTDPDIARWWRNDRDPFGTEPSTENALRCAIANYWMHGRWWINDPDPALLRTENLDLTFSEIQTLASVVALGGGSVFLSDNLTMLEAERAALLPRLLPPTGRSARPLSPGTTVGFYQRMRLDLADGVFVAALFNWQDTACQLNFDPALWACSGAFYLHDAWTGEYWYSTDEAVLLPPTPAHGLRLLTVTPARQRPHVIGTDLHLLGGVFITEAWDGAALTITLRLPGERRGKVWIATNSGHVEVVGIGGHNLQRHIWRG